MYNNKIRDFIAEEHPEAYVFNLPSFDNAILGITDDGRVIYSYDLMIDELSKDIHITPQEAQEFIDYNTLRSMEYINLIHRPIILFNYKIIKELQDD